MYFAQIEITKPQGRKKTATNAVLDTGFTGGVWLPKRVAQAIGAQLVEPARRPLTMTGEEIDGKGTIVVVRFVAAGAATETLGFVPDDSTDEILVGAYALAAVDARIVIGDTAYGPAQRTRGRNRKGASERAPYDFSSWVIPNRPVNRWW